METNTTGQLWIWVTATVLVIVLAAYFAFASSGSPAPSQGGEGSNGATATSSALTNGSTTVKFSPTSGRAPVVKTIGFASVSSTTAVVVGSVIPENSETTYWFEYGTSLNFGRVVDAQSVKGGMKEVGAAGYITGFKPGTEYYFRIAAENAYGRVFGGPYKFITAAK